MGAKSLGVVISVDLDVLTPLFRQVVLGEDRAHRALVHAQPAVDAGAWIDVELRGWRKCSLGLGGVDAVDGADLDATGILGRDARFSNDVWHGRWRGVERTDRSVVRRKNTESRLEAGSWCIA